MDRYLDRLNYYHARVARAKNESEKNAYLRSYLFVLKQFQKAVKAVDSYG